MIYWDKNNYRALPGGVFCSAKKTNPKAWVFLQNKKTQKTLQKTPCCASSPQKIVSSLRSLTHLTSTSKKCRTKTGTRFSDCSIVGFFATQKNPGQQKEFISQIKNRFKNTNSRCVVTKAKSKNFSDEDFSLNPINVQSARKGSVSNQGQKSGNLNSISENLEPPYSDNGGIGFFAPIGGSRQLQKKKNQVQQNDTIEKKLPGGKARGIANVTNQYAHGQTGGKIIPPIIIGGINNTRSGNRNAKQEIVSITYEEIGLFPRSFSRVLDRFIKQIFSDVENLVIQEYRFYRYLFLTTGKCVLILFFIPFLVNFFAKNYLVRPLAEYFWNTKQTEIFLNSYQQKRAFVELKDFEEKLYFESLIVTKAGVSKYLHSNLQPAIESANKNFQFGGASRASLFIGTHQTLANNEAVSQSDFFAPIGGSRQLADQNKKNPGLNERLHLERAPTGREGLFAIDNNLLYHASLYAQTLNEKQSISNNIFSLKKDSLSASQKDSTFSPIIAIAPVENSRAGLSSTRQLSSNQLFENKSNSNLFFAEGCKQKKKTQAPIIFRQINEFAPSLAQQGTGQTTFNRSLQIGKVSQSKGLAFPQRPEGAFKTQQRLQEKTIELAKFYNDQSIEAITNFFADLMSFLTLFYLLFALEIQINITKSFLLEVFFGLDDSKKSLLILLITDLLVGYHSSNIWELFFSFLFNHYGLPESQTGIFLLVATLPVLLDVLFKYLIFRHLNRSSPATVATYHAMIE